MTIFKRMVTAAAVTMALAAPVLAFAQPASAASRDGACDTGEFCLYYFTDYSGSISDFTGSVSNYGTTEPSCYDFKSAGAGQGECVKNNAESVWNRSTHTVRVYFNSDYTGAFQDFAPGTYGNLNSSMIDNNASHKFL